MSLDLRRFVGAPIVPALVVLFGLSAGMATAAPGSVARATFRLGCLVGLDDGRGHTYVGGARKPAGLTIRRVGGDHEATAEAARPGGADLTSFTGLPGALARLDRGRDPATGDITVQARCDSPQAGVAGLEWSVGPIPKSMNIIIPGYSGIRLTSHSSTTSLWLEYPMFWEAQMVIVEGRGQGFSIWSDDTTSRFKRLQVTLKPDGWWLGFTTWNAAPFDKLTSCSSVRWRVNTYQGDWRAPARRYRAWALRNLPPVGGPQPSWVRDIRCVATLYCGPSLKALELLAADLDPRQTLVYVPDWRPEGYDRLYPNYDPVPQFGPFLKRAHQLGFRVMPHLNYFAIDPNHPLYERFKPYHIRDPWGSHEQQCFIWDDPSNPANNRKLAYINPAYRPWRQELVDRIRRLRSRYAVDAVYLDQTLNLYNDHNGLVDGQGMPQGNLALGREIRAALPDLAIGGEMLNEVTARYQAFCQRHAWGVDFDRGTWNREQLRQAHPVSSYLFASTQPFHYIGAPPPSRPQYYAAWREVYARWGVLPTVKLYDDRKRDHTGFERQLYQEARFWQSGRVVRDMEAPWPNEVLFPYRAADGRRVLRTRDGRLLCGSQEISRTVSDVTEVRGGGTIEGALCYDRDRIFGLDPDVWQPYFSDRRDPSAFHVAALPAGVRLQSCSNRPGLAVMRSAETVVAYLPALMARATTGVQPDAGVPTQLAGPLNGEDGSQFATVGDQLHAHPPWRNGPGNAYARWSLALPKGRGLRFTCTVGLDSGAAGKSDGVLFGVTARCGGETRHTERLTASAEPQALDLDLSPFAGRPVSLELWVDPGKARQVTADWARWYRPRIVADNPVRGVITVVDPRRKALALFGTSVSQGTYRGNQARLEVGFPGTVMLLGDTPAPATVPLDLSTAPFRVDTATTGGDPLAHPDWASAIRGVGTVGGKALSGLKVQPPDLGRTNVSYALRLPTTPCRLQALVGIEDGSLSTGVEFIVQVNGIDLARRRMMPGDPWTPLDVDLAPWRGKVAVVSLMTDSAGSYGSDWARWGQPTLVVAGR